MLRICDDCQLPASVGGQNQKRGKTYTLGLIPGHRECSLARPPGGHNLQKVARTSVLPPLAAQMPRVRKQLGQLSLGVIVDDIRQLLKRPSGHFHVAWASICDEVADGASPVVAA